MDTKKQKNCEGVKMESEKIVSSTEEKASEMKMVEQEIRELRNRLENMSNNAIAVYDCIRNGEVPTKGILSSNQTGRKSGDTRFQEMRLGLREDCGTLCESIYKTLEEIRLLVR